MTNPTQNTYSRFDDVLQSFATFAEEPLALEERSVFVLFKGCVSNIDAILLYAETTYGKQSTLTTRVQKYYWTGKLSLWRGAPDRVLSAVLGHEDYASCLMFGPWSQQKQPTFFRSLFLSMMIRGFSKDATPQQIAEMQGRREIRISVDTYKSALSRLEIKSNIHLRRDAYSVQNFLYALTSVQGTADFINFMNTLDPDSPKGQYLYGALISFLSTSPQIAYPQAIEHATKTLEAPGLDEAAQMLMQLRQIPPA